MSMPATKNTKKTTAKESNQLFLEELKVTYKLTDSVLVAVLVGYADEVQAYLDTPSKPGTVPISFAEFLRKVDAAFKRDDEEQARTAANKADTQLQKILVDDVVIEADVKDSVDEEETIPLEEFEATYTLSEEGSEREQLIGREYSGKKLQVVWEDTCELENGYKVKISIKTGNQIIGVVELLDEKNKTCSRLKPRTDKLRGSYFFSWKHLRINFTIV